MSQFDEQTLNLQQSIFRSKIAKAKRATMAQNMADGPMLFDQSMRLMRDAIRTEYPEFSDAQIQGEVRRRLRIAKRIDDASIYQDAGTIDGQP
jgi:hypothetical protein